MSQTSTDNQITFKDSIAAVVHSAARGVEEPTRRGMGGKIRLPFFKTSESRRFFSRSIRGDAATAISYRCY